MTTHDKRCFSLTRLLIGLAATLFFSQVQALGLGKLQVQSALDEPLVAEIELNAVTEEALETLELSLGSAEAFQQADIERPEFLNQMEFRVRKVGKPAIIINTTEPAREPFLHFIIDAQWSDGKLVREYTALLDPPLYTAEKPTAVSMPGVVDESTPQMDIAEPVAAPVQPDSATAPVRPEPTVAAQSESAASAPESPAYAFSGAEYGPTLRGDTLWGIASQFDTSGYGVNVFQVMIALLRQNPDAFVDNNVNRMKVGQILRLSNLDELQSVPKDEASLSYQNQLAEWESYKSRLALASEELMIPAPDAAQGEGGQGVAQSEEQADQTAASTASAEAAETTMAESAPAMEQIAESEPSGVAPESTEQDLLKIVQATLDATPEESASASGTSADIESVKATAAKEMNALREQINTLEEALASRELQNNDLQQRVELLEGQVENAKRLVELESQELALAQQQAAQAEQQAQEAAEQALLAQQLAEQAQQAQQAQAKAEQAQQAQAKAEQAQQAQAKAEQAQQAQAKAEQAQQAQAKAEQAQQAQAKAEQPAQTAQPTGLAKNNVVEPIPSAQPKPKAEKTRVVAGGSKPAATAQPAVQRSSSKSWWESGLEMLQDSAMSLIAGLVGILVLLAAALLFVRRRRSIAEFEESILSGSGLDEQTESTDTAATNKGTDTSFLSDFGMAGMGSMQADEVDPLAEAEVYLAYGRDEQAEEVLKEAASRNPTRHELKLKLLEIYQQRDDVKSFETLAEELYPAGGQGDLTTWHKVAEMGLKMNPDNPLFAQELPGGLAESLIDSEPLLQPDDVDLPQDIVAETSAPVDPALQPFPAPDKAAQLDGELDQLGGDFDEPIAGAPAETDSTPSLTSSGDSEMLNFAAKDVSELDFDIDLGEMDQIEDDSTAVEEPVDLNLDLGDTLEQADDESSDAVLEFTDELATIPAGNGNGSGQGDEEEVVVEASEQWDEAATKLDLAQAYLNMGDKAGARSIIDEVMKEGSPAQRNQAAELAAQLS